MSDKQILVEKIKKWLEIESKINQLQKDLKEFKKAKSSLSIDLSEIMKNKNLECIDVTQGQILYTKTETKKSINQKYLANVLSKYFENDLHAKQVCDFILSNREKNIKENIRLKSYKNKKEKEKVKEK